MIVRQRYFFTGAVADLVHATQASFGGGELGLRLMQLVVRHELGELFWVTANILAWHIGTLGDDINLILDGDLFKI